MLNQLASDWLKTKEFQEVVEDVMRMLRNFMGNKTFLITHMQNKRFTVLQSVEGSVKIKEGHIYSSDESVYHQWDGGIKEVLIINDTSKHTFLQGSEICVKFGIRSYLGVPLLLKNGDFFGTMCAIDNKPYDFTPVDVDTMRTLANLMVKALEIIRMSVIDHLTGLYNKAYLEKKFEILSSNNDSKELLGLMLFDLDNFKFINDSHGHCVGDDVLQFIGRAVKKCMPEDSTAFRFGGDEFCIFFPYMNSDSIVEYAQRLQKQISTYKATKISLSIGISDTTLSDYESLIDTADIALYKAKKKGKNQYSIYVD